MITCHREIYITINISYLLLLFFFNFTEFDDNKKTA